MMKSHSAQTIMFVLLIVGLFCGGARKASAAEAPCSAKATDVNALQSRKGVVHLTATVVLDEPCAGELCHAQIHWTVVMRFRTGPEHSYKGIGGGGHIKKGESSVDVRGYFPSDNAAELVSYSIDEVTCEAFGVQ